MIRNKKTLRKKRMLWFDFKNEYKTQFKSISLPSLAPTAAEQGKEDTEDKENRSFYKFKP